MIAHPAGMQPCGVFEIRRQGAPGEVLVGRAKVRAERAHRGLASHPNPIPSWDWRHGKGMLVTAAVVGNRNSHVYHSPHCRAVAVMKPKNRVVFETAAAVKE